MGTSSLPRVWLLLLPLLVASFVLGRTASAAAAGPSAFCHVTDGTFTTCPDGSNEWSDVPVKAFSETQSFLYASQANLDPAKGGPVSPVDTFVLMYDECGRRVPLGPDEYFRVAFRTVGTETGFESLEHYVIHIFTDGTIIFIEDSVVQPPGRAQVVHEMRGKVGFGKSPNCDFDHIVAEFQVPLSITGSSYSPDPLFWAASSPPPTPPPCPANSIRLPVMINVLDNVAISDSALHEMISEANIIMSQAGVCADSTSLKIVRDADDQGNRDGKVSELEYRSIEIACSRELASKDGGFGVAGKGIKIVMANELFREHNIAGLNDSGHSPCIYLKADAPDLGFSLAHELGHAFGMAPGTPIGDEVLDDEGHSADSGNLMDPFLGGGIELNEQQITIIQNGAKERSFNTEHGGWIDAIGDVSLSHIDLMVGTFFATDLSGTLEIVIRLVGPHPTTPVSSTFELLFDTDNNPNTGGIIGTHQGIDKVLRVTLTGRFPFTAPDGSIIASLVDVLTGTSTPLTPGNVTRAQIIADTFSATPPTVFTAGDVIRQTVSLSALGLTARAVPVVVQARDNGSGHTDEAAFAFQLSGAPGTAAIRPGFDAASLPANDDASTALLPLGFSINFFGASLSGVFVNNNGNVTFDAPLPQFTPFGFTNTGRVIIAPFFADVDTRVGNVVTFGSGIVEGRPAFGANWPGVGCFDQNVTVLNFFQVLLINRADIAPGDFDIEFNYDSLQWEAGEASGGSAACLGGVAARAGFSNGTGVPGTFFELPGSGLPGAFLDTNLESGLIHTSLNADRPGRYVFRVRSGVPEPSRDQDADGVPDDLDNCPKVANPDQRDDNLNGIGDACETGFVNSTAAFMQAEFDGTTVVEPRPLAASQEPSLLEQLVRIVEFRVASGLSVSAETTAANLVASLVALNLVAPQDAQALADAVARQVIQPLRGDINRDGQVDNDDLTLLLTERNKPVGQSVCGRRCDLDGDGMITALDARILVQLCTRPRCATQ